MIYIVLFQSRKTSYGVEMTPDRYRFYSTRALFSLLVCINNFFGTDSDMNLIFLQYQKQPGAARSSQKHPEVIRIARSNQTQPREQKHSKKKRELGVRGGIIKV